MGFFNNYTKPGKGITEDDLNKTGIALYFDILIRRFWKFVQINLLFLATSLPAILINFAVSAFLLSMMNVFNFGMIPEDAFIVPYVFTAAVLLLLGGSGSAGAAMAHVIRKFVNDTHSWTASDFFDSLKNNLKQGTAAYVINTAVIAVLALAIMFYDSFLGGASGFFLKTVTIIAAVIFCMMQMYVYQIMAGFELKLKDIYRNALLLTMGKLPTNIVAFLFTALFIYLFNLIVSEPYAVFFIIFVLYSLTAYTQLFITNNIVKKYLEEPARRAQMIKERKENQEG